MKSEGDHGRDRKRVTEMSNRRTCVNELKAKVKVAQNTVTQFHKSKEYLLIKKNEENIYRDAEETFTRCILPAVQIVGPNPLLSNFPPLHHSQTHITLPFEQHNTTAVK